MTVFGIDFDGTWSRDPGIWSKFTADVLAAGHKVWVVTARRDDEEELVQDVLDVTGLPRWRHVFTRLQAKRPFCEERGIKIDVWIDDDPQYIENSR